MTLRVRLLLVGVGNVGSRFLNLMHRKRGTLVDNLGLELILVGAADSSGAIISADGIEPQVVIDLKSKGQGVADHQRCGRPGLKALDMVEMCEAELLLDASPGNIETGQPGLGCIEAGLDKGMHVVTANKSPLVLAYSRLMAKAQKKGLHLRFDATVAGGLPAINLGRRDLAAADIYRLEGIVNLTTNYILTRMAQDGLGYDEALAEAQKAGHAETDPTLDVEGWDAANKLVILSNSVLGYPATLDEVTVKGITAITSDELREAEAAGKRVKLLASAQQDGEGYRLDVRPVWLDAGHPMAQLGPKQMGIVYHTDISGSISAAIVEETPEPTASAMLRDVVDVFAG
jgi:homoserine dehydrogenase